MADIYKDVPEDVQYAEELDSEGNKVVLSGDKEKHIDGLIANSQQLLGEGYRVFHQAALHAILDDIKDDLADFGVTFNQWFSEASLSAKLTKRWKHLINVASCMKKMATSGLNRLNLAMKRPCC